MASSWLGALGFVQGFAESLQQDSSNQSEIVMIKLYCCGPEYCSIYPLLYYFFQIRHGLGSSVFKLCCKDSAKPCRRLQAAKCMYSEFQVACQGCIGKCLDTQKPCCGGQQ